MLKCEYCGTAAGVDSNCQNCGGPTPVLGVIRDIRIWNSPIEITTMSSSERHFMKGLERAQVTLDVDVQTAKRLLDKFRKQVTRVSRRV